MPIREPINDSMRKAGADVISQFNGGCDFDLAEKVYSAMHANTRSEGGYVRKPKEQCLKRGPAPKTTNHYAIIQLFVSGKTMQEVGDKFSLSRERVRQILKKNGISASSGGYALHPKDMGLKLAVAIDKRSIAKYGLPHKEMNKYRSSGLVEAFRRQKQNAATRGIQWMLSFAEWISIWEKSGKLGERGRGAAGFCMARNLDKGPYAICNVSIKSGKENGKEAIQNTGGRKAKFTGVWCIYPGSKLPWVAKYGKTQIGRFQSEEEAVNQRAEVIKTQTPIEKRLIASNKSGFVGVHKVGKKYVASIQRAGGSLYVGSFLTPEEASMARELRIEIMKYTGHEWFDCAVNAEYRRTFGEKP